MSVRVAAANLLAIARRHNLKAAAIDAWASVMPKKRVVYLVALTEPRSAPRVLEAGKNHTFRFATVDEVSELRSQSDIPLGDNDVVAAATGDRCLLQLDGDTLAGYAWIAGSPLVYIAEGVHFNLPNDTVYNYKAFTPPEYRGHGFQALRHLKLLEVLRGEGKHRLFGYVDRLNFSSLKGVHKSGYRRVGTLTIRRRGGAVRALMKVDENFWCDDRRICLPEGR